MKLVEWLDPLLEWLWQNKNYILEQDESNLERPGDSFGFEVFYPEYGGMPEEIGQHLSDFHQDILNKYVVFYLKHYSTKEKFCQKLCDELTNCTVIF